MRRYASIGEQNVPATAGSSQADATIMTLQSATTVRPHLYFLSFGCAGTPADQAWTIQVGRQTAAGTGTASTLSPMSTTDPASLCSGKYNQTAAPTYTAGAVLMSVDLNQRASFSWIEDPERGIVLPASTDGVGLFFAVASGGTPLCHATFHHAE